MEHKHRHHWTDAMIEAGLKDVVAEIGRMPSGPELVARGRNDLCAGIVRSGGYRAWARRLNASLKGTETHRGQAVEDAMEDWLTLRNFPVMRMSTCAPFDFLLHEHIRIDVKSAQYGEYGKRQSTGRPTGKGFTFGLNKAIPTCDLYILCGVDADNAILWRYFIPASAARVQTVHITPQGKYRPYLEDVSQLSRLLGGADSA